MWSATDFNRSSTACSWGTVWGLRTRSTALRSCGADAVVAVDALWELRRSGRAVASRPCAHACAHVCTNTRVRTRVWRAYAREHVCASVHVHTCLPMRACVPQQQRHPGFSFPGAPRASLLCVGRPRRHHHGHRPGHGNQRAEVSVSGGALPRVSRCSPGAPAKLAPGVSPSGPRQHPSCLQEVTCTLLSLQRQ